MARDVVEILRVVVERGQAIDRGAVVLLMSDARAILALLEVGEDYAKSDPDDGVDFVEGLAEFPDAWRRAKEAGK